MKPEGLFGVAVGLFIMGAAVMDWEFFMSHRKARPLVWLLGRFGARVFYVVLGAIFLVAGLLYSLGVVS